MSRGPWTTMTTLALALAGWPLLPSVAYGQDVGAREPVQEEPMTGRAIADRVMERLRADPAVDTGEIGVVVVDGELTMSGTAPSLDVKERAERLAEEVRGVTAVNNRIRVRPLGPHTDRQIEHYVERALASDPTLGEHELDAKVKRGVVTLRGEVSSGAERQLAREIAADVFAVRAVRERLTVTPVTMATTTETTPMAAAMEPAALGSVDERRRAIEDALAWDARLDAGALEVHVEGSTALLAGTVATLAERRRAVEAAYVPGIHDVDARALAVDPSTSARAGAKPAPQGSVAKASAGAVQGTAREPLADAIASGLARHPRLAERRLTVEVEGSSVTLRGVVDSLAARRAASDVALAHAGVSEVRNRLRVDPSLPSVDALAAVVAEEAASTAAETESAATTAAWSAEEAPAPAERRWTDEEVAGEVREALRRDPYLHTKPIRVDVVAGEVYLDGEVASAFERARAAEVVGRVRGASGLHDELEVPALAASETTAALACDPAPAQDAPSTNQL